jgi:hypothetical protein
MMMMVSTMLRSLSTSSGNLQRPAVYASPLAFEWQPQAPTGQTLPFARDFQFSAKRTPISRACRTCAARPLYRDRAVGGSYWPSTENASKTLPAVPPKRP